MFVALKKTQIALTRRSTRVHRTHTSIYPNSNSERAHSFRNGGEVVDPRFGGRGDVTALTCLNDLEREFGRGPHTYALFVVLGRGRRKLLFSRDSIRVIPFLNFILILNNCCYGDNFLFLLFVTK